MTEETIDRPNLIGVGMDPLWKQSLKMMINPIPNFHNYKKVTRVVNDVTVNEFIKKSH
jgi:hypothetical protein